MFGSAVDRIQIIVAIVKEVAHLFPGAGAQAGIVAPESVSKVVLVRTEVDAGHAHEPETARDTSVDRTLDAQVGDARHREDAGNGDLLNHAQAQRPDARRQTQSP